MLFVCGRITRLVWQPPAHILVIGPRAAFAEIERFAGLDRRWPDEALAQVQGDPRTALVTLTHDPKLDDPALDWALRTPAFDIGALGRHTKAACSASPGAASPWPMGHASTDRSV